MKLQLQSMDAIASIVSNEEIRKKAIENLKFLTDNQFKEYTNDAPNSKISTIWTQFAKPYPKFFVQYKDQAAEAHDFMYIAEFFNKSLSDPDMALSQSIKEEISKNSYGALKKDIHSENYLDPHGSISARFYSVPSVPVTNEQKELSEIKITHIPWYKFNVNFESLAKAGHDLLKQNPHAKIFSLGQSPAWIVKAAEFISALKQPAHYIPFSGKFYKTHQEKNGAMSMKLSDLVPTDDQKESYYNVLKKLDLHPQQISDMYKSDGVKTVVVDYVCTAGGITSFLSLLFSLAKKDGIDVESLKDSLDIILLTAAKEDAINRLIFDDITIECKNQVVKDIEALTCTVDKGQYSDRIVPYYPYTKWEAEPEPTEGSKNFIESLINKIAAISEQYVSSVPLGNEAVEVSNNTTFHSEDLATQDAVNTVGNMGDVNLIS